MNISEGIIQAFENTFSVFGLTINFNSENTEKSLNSTEEINILIGLSNGLKGNIVISFKQETALKIISSMTGGMVVESIDEMGESALGEMANILMGNTFAAFSDELDEPIELSPPTIARGKNIYMMISNMPARKICFKLRNQNLYIRYAIYR